MYRRQFLAALGGLTALSQSRARKQNVLFIAVDDLNDWVGCLGGHPDTKTPNIDRLIARGLNFTRAYCAAPVCNPSRASLMTGIRPSTHGVYENQQPMRESPVLKNAVTLTEHFMANGYRAIGGGKIFHGGYPDPPSWNDYFPSQTQNQPPKPKPPKRPWNGIPKSANFDWGPLENPDSDMGDYKTVDWVSSQLQQKHDKPFFLACGIYKPHLEWFVPKKYYDEFPLDKVTLPTIKEDDLDDVPAVGKWLALRSGDQQRIVRDAGKYREAVQAYLAAIAFADAQVGRVLDALDKSAYATNTIIVLWSDHGWHLGQKMHWRKFALWEEATHNLFGIVAPGITKPNSRCDRVVSLIDIYPTLIDICGLPTREGLEGQSLLPLLKNPGQKWDRPALTTYLRGNHSIRDERYRYIRYNDGGEELYDHDNDPHEWTNLAGKSEYAQVKTRLAKWLPKTDAPDSPKWKGVGTENPEGD